MYLTFVCVCFCAVCNKFNTESWLGHSRAAFVSAGALLGLLLTKTDLKKNDLDVKLRHALFFVGGG